MLKNDLDTLRKHAEEGDPEAQYDLAGLYYNADGVEKDYDEAAKWLHKAAEQGHSRAQCNLGVCLFTRICGRNPVPGVRQAGDISTLLQF